MGRAGAALGDRIDPETRQRLEELYGYVHRPSQRREAQSVGRGNLLYGPNYLSDDEYSHWKRVQREMSALYK